MEHTRERHDRELVRRTALLLSANLPLQEAFGQLCELLADFVDAPIVLVCSASLNTARVEYALIDGIADVPDDPLLPSNSVSAMALTSGRSILFRTASEWPEAFVAVTIGGRGSNPQSAMFVPILFGGEAVGVLSVQTERENAYDQGDLETLETCALYLGALMHDESRRGEVDAPASNSSIDGLTGAASRSHFDAVLESERRRCEREGAQLSLVLLDIDHFKAFNDAYGHVAGDTCLRHIAGTAARCVGRPGDLFARYEGEQFIAVLPWTGISGAIVVAERMRRSVFQLAMPHDRSSLRRLSVSIGVASLVPHRDSTSESLMREAVAQLQRAKSAGRNRVAAPDYGSASEAADRKASAANNLPEPRTSFIGRVEDVSNIWELLLSDRLVSIVGPGGSGKTRTAIESCRAMLGHFPDGIWFVDLAPLEEVRSIIAAIAASVHGASTGPQDVSQLAARLSRRRLLLLLDSCEHATQACAQLADRLLDAAPGISLLVTSREPLGVAGERVYRLPMLAPEDAVQLFLERARNSGVRWSGERSTIERIAARLDGMPLAIELAAARLAVMSANDLLQGLDDCLNLLRPSTRALPTRQQTLHALIDWSYDLLDEAEQRVFSRLAVFPTTWSLESAVAVCNCDAEAPASAIGEIEALVAKSLVERIGEYENSRFRLLNVTHEYARLLLDRSGESKAMLAALGRYFTELAQIRAERLMRTSMHEWLALQLPERENYQLALRWCLSPEGDPMLAQSLLESLRHWFHARGAADFGEILPLLESSLAGGELPDSVCAAASLAAADLYGNRDLRRCRECAERALHLYRELGDGIGAAHALERLGVVQRYLEGGVDAQLEIPIRNTVFSAKRNGDKRLAAMLLRVLCDVYAAKESVDSLALEREVLLEACDLLRECGDEDRAGGALARLAVAAFWSGDYEEARNTCRAAITLMEQAEEPWDVAFQMMNLGLYEIYRDDLTAARVALQKSMDLLQRHGHEYAAANIFLYYAILARRAGRERVATHLVAYADTLFASGPRQQARLQPLRDQTVRDLQAALGEAGFERERQAGRRMGWEEALHEAQQA